MATYTANFENLDGTVRLAGEIEYTGTVQPVSNASGSVLIHSKAFAFNTSGLNTIRRGGDSGCVEGNPTLADGFFHKLSTVTHLFGTAQESRCLSQRTRQ